MAEAIDGTIPRWTFTFHAGQDEPFVHMLMMLPPKEVEVKAMQVFTPGDVVRVLVSDDSYTAAREKAVDAYTSR